MGSKKHHSRKNDSSSSESESSDHYPVHNKKTHQRNSSEESDDKPKSSKSRHHDRERGRKSHDSPSRHERKHSRSRSHDRRSDYRDRSSDREHHKKELERDKERVSSSRKDFDKEEKKRERDYYESRHDRGRDRRDNFSRDGDRSGPKRRSRSRSFDHVNAKWGKIDEKKKDGKSGSDREKPNFALSGKLAEQTNTYRGVVIKYSEPPEARKPRRRWRLYPFKGDKALQTLYIHRESAYLIGRDRKVVDLPVDHPSCSKQHAALQYRLVPFTRDDGSVGKRVRPYLIDLESANGTYINNKKIEPKKYVELLERDVIKFGYSSREYVLLHENSKDEGMDDDVKGDDEGIKEEIDVKEELFVTC